MDRAMSADGSSEAVAVAASTSVALGQRMVERWVEGQEVAADQVEGWQAVLSAVLWMQEEAPEAYLIVVAAAVGGVAGTVAECCVACWAAGTRHSRVAAERMFAEAAAVLTSPAGM